MIAETPNQIRVFQLISAKHAIKLEALGMRHSRLGRNGCRRAWAKYYGLSPRAKAEAVIARIQEEIDSLSTQLGLLL